MVESADTTAAGVDSALGATGVGLILVGLGLAAVELEQHWKEVMAAMETATVAAANTISSAIEEITGGLVKLGHSTTEAQDRAKEAKEGNEAEKEGNQNPAWRPGATSNLSHGQLGNSNQYGFVAETAKRYGVSPNTLWGIYGTETTYGKNITTSKTGAEGAFQFEPETAKAYGYPETNKPNAKQFQAQAEAAARYIAAETRKYHSEAKAVEAYYAGHPGGQSGYLHEVEAKGGAHYGKAQEEALQTGSGNAAIEKLLHEAGESKAEKEAAKAKKTTAALGIPTGVATMLATAQALLGAPYTLGGGHGSSANDPIEMLKKIGVDCSGFVSKVLSSGGLPTTGLTTEGLASSGALAKGKGRYVTVYDRANAGADSHVIADILGHYFESGGQGGKGVHQMSAAEVKAELAGGGFQALHPTSLNTPVSGGTTEAAINQKTEAALTTLIKGSETLQKKYEAEIQSGTPAALEKALGVSTAGTVPGPPIIEEYLKGNLSKKTVHPPESVSALAGQVAAGTGNIAQLEGVLSKSASKSVAGKEFSQVVATLKAAGLTGLADKLVATHKQALETLTHELVTVEETKQAEGLKLQATQEKDRNTLAEHLATNQLAVVKAEEAQQTDAMKAATALMAAQTTRMADSFSALAQSIEAATR